MVFVYRLKKKSPARERGYALFRGRAENRPERFGRTDALFRAARAGDALLELEARGVKNTRVRCAAYPGIDEGQGESIAIVDEPFREFPHDGFPGRGGE